MEGGAGYDEGIHSSYIESKGGWGGCREWRGGETRGCYEDFRRLGLEVAKVDSD